MAVNVGLLENYNREHYLNSLAIIAGYLFLQQNGRFAQEGNR
jgi:hypothetical protein